MAEEIIIKVKADTGNADKGLENIKRTTKETNTAAKEAAGNFQVMGVSLNSIKGIFGKIIPVAKGMFSTIKAGIASTGIGLLVLAIGSLVSYFTNTKKGAEQLQVAFKAVGAAIAVITDRISSIGSAIVKVFQGDFKGAAEDAKGAITGLGEEIRNETQAMIELTKTLQRVKDAERDFSKERAQTNQVIAEARMIAEDETKSYEERLAALQEANQLEISTTEKAIALQKEKLEAKRIEIEQSESMAEDLDELAALEVELIDMQTASFMKRKRLMTSEETLRREQEALKRQDEKDRQAALDEEMKKEEELATKRADITNQIALLEEEDAERREILALEQQANKLLAQEEDAEMQRLIKEKLELDKATIAKKYADIEKKNNDQLAKEKIEDEKAVKAAKQQLALGTLGLIQDTFGKESAAGKAAAVAQATINTYQGVTAALASAPPPVNAGLAAITAAAGFKAVADIVATKEPTFARGGMVRGQGTGTSDSIRARLSKGETVINARSTRMFKPLLSAINEAGGGVGFASGGTLDTSSNGATMGTVKAFVVTDDITNSQNQLERIRQKATI